MEDLARLPDVGHARLYQEVGNAAPEQAGRRADVVEHTDPVIVVHPGERGSVGGQDLGRLLLQVGEVFGVGLTLLLGALLDLRA